jgi:hypothetical protein
LIFVEERRGCIMRDSEKRSAPALASAADSRGGREEGFSLAAGEREGPFFRSDRYSFLRFSLHLDNLFRLVV